MNAKVTPPPELLARLGTRIAYRVPGHPAPVDLFLASNEGRGADTLPIPGEWLPDAARLARYPDTGGLAARLARELGVDADQLLVTAGADDSLFRACTAALVGGREALVPVPTFEMIPRYVELAGGVMRAVDWPADRFPLDELLAGVSDRTGLVVVVSPNNPTGQVATAEDLARLAAAAPHALFVLDQAYAEFADEDLTAAALALGNAVVLRTLSKAWGLAGLRVGYAVGAAELVGALASAGNPYPVSSLSLALADARHATGRSDMEDYVAAVRAERGELAELLARHGAAPLESQANFVFARTPRAEWMRDALAGLGIGVRTFPDRAGLEDAIRITCPGRPEAFARLCAGLEAALAPEALLWDMDGVLADVSRSFRRAIVETAKSFGVAVGAEEVERAKAAGDANDDWALTARLVRAGGVEAELTEVTERFEALYQGTEEKPGLHAEEVLLPPRESLERLAARLPMAVVTGRPRADAERFVADHGLEGLFATLVCREDAPLKPDPAPVRLALERLGVRRAWMLGDTPDDLAAARSAGVVPLGVQAFEQDGNPDEAMRAALFAAGAARILSRTADLEDLL